VSAWPIYAVTVNGFPPYDLTARSPAAARYEAFLSYSECRDVSFRDFIRICAVRRTEQPVIDGYGYVRRAYGVNPKIGQRVRLRNEGSAWNGKEGVVLYPNRQSTASVHVAMPGIKHPLLVHPDNVELLPMEQAA
jgi:hypothetical protein